MKIWNITNESRENFSTAIACCFYILNCQVYLMQQICDKKALRSIDRFGFNILELYSVPKKE